MTRQMQEVAMKKIFASRPFKSRNAEDFELNEILSLFVQPSGEIQNPFEFENSIVKGRMGTGKTMFLRANYAYYLYTLVPSIMERAPLILPVFIRLSDFQHLRSPEDVYRAVILKIIDELCAISLQIQDAKKLAMIHSGLKAWPEKLSFPDSIHDVADRLLKLGADEYSVTITKSLGLGGGVKSDFFETSATFEKGVATEVKKKERPGINDVHAAFKVLIGDYGGKLLVLLDEAGSLHKSFFKQGKETSFFEILMNQLRTADFLRTKIAVYPQSYSDILTETRYGDMILLNDEVKEEHGHLNFRKRATQFIARYLTAANSGIKCEARHLFSIDEKLNSGDCLEQLINASDGNMRRLSQLLDTAMAACCERGAGREKVNTEDSATALRRHADAMINIYTPQDKEFLDTIAKACRSRGTFRFQFPYKSPVLSKFVSKSEEYNILAITDAGGGRRGTTYAFDYAYCVHHEIPTHYLQGTERVDKARSKKTGAWIPRVAKISEELLQHANVPGKIEGTVGQLWIDKGCGFLQGDDQVEYFFSTVHIVSFDKGKKLATGQRLRFFPAQLENGKIALAIEIL